MNPHRATPESPPPPAAPTREPSALPTLGARTRLPAGIALGSACLILLASCGGGSGGGSGPTGDLSGTVREATRATPIAGATVKFGTRQTTTAADGSFEFLGLSGGEQTLSVTAPGYEPYAQSVTVDAGANTRDVQLSVKTFYQYGNYGAYIPPFVETLHGTLFVIGGAGTGNGSLGLVPGSAAPCVAGFCGSLESPLQTFANAVGFALVGEAVTDRTGNNTGPAVVGPGLTGLASAAAHHPELQHAPVLLLGLSWGGCRAYEYAAVNGPRVIGFITVKGGCHPETPQSGAQPVPGYLFIGEDDTSSRSRNITAAFEANRPAGALWALAVEPGAGHTLPADVGLLFQWMADVVSLRLPASVTPGQPVVLQAIAETDGWLGNRLTFATCAFDCYASDPDQAAWLPSAQTASRWAAFVSNPGGGGGGGGLSVRAPGAD